MAKSIQLRFAICLSWFFGLVLTSMAAYAAENERLAFGLEAIPFSDLKYCLVIILIGGLLSTLMKMTNIEAPRVRSVPLEIVKDALGSLAAGLLGYLTIRWIDQEVYKIHILLQPGVIFFCAFGGTRIIEPFYNEGFTGVLGMFRAFLARLVGKQSATSAGEDKP